MKHIRIQIPHTKPIVHIKSNDDEILEWLYISYIPFSQKENTNNLVNCGEVTINVIKEKGVYYLLFDEQKIIIDNVNRVIGRLTHYINCLLTTEEPYIGLHCGMVSNNNMNYLLVGVTGAGKSTLSMYLSERGYQYYSDDSVLINCSDKTIIPFFKAIHLRKESSKVLEEYGIKIDKSNTYLGEEIRYRQERIKKEIIQDNEMKIIFLNRREQEKAQIILMNKQIALKNIVKNLIFLKNFHKSTIYAFKLVATTECYEIQYSKLDDAKRLLESIGDIK